MGKLISETGQNSREALRDQAITQLMNEIRAGRDSVRSESDWVPEEDMLARFGIEAGTAE